MKELKMSDNILNLNNNCVKIRNKKEFHILFTFAALIGIENFKFTKAVDLDSFQPTMIVTYKNQQFIYYLDLALEYKI
jgi:hypothetical protein